MKKPQNFSVKSPLALKADFQGRKLLSGQTVKKDDEEESNSPNLVNQSFENSLSLNIEDSRENFSKIQNKTSAFTPNPIPIPVNLESLQDSSTITIATTAQFPLQKLQGSRHHYNFHEMMRSQKSLNNSQSSVELVGAQLKEISFGHEDSLMMNLIGGNEMSILSLANTITENKSSGLQVAPRRLSRSGKSSPREGSRESTLIYKKQKSQQMRQQLDMHRQIISENMNFFNHNNTSLGEAYSQSSTQGGGPLTDRLDKSSKNGDYSNILKRTHGNRSSRDSSGAHLLLFSEKDFLTFVKEEEETTTIMQDHSDSMKNQVNSMKLSSEDFKNSNLPCKNVFDKLYKEGLHLQEKRREMSNVRIDESLGECTFKPVINHYPSTCKGEDRINGDNIGLSSMNWTRRNNEQFFQDQIKFQEMKNQKVMLQRRQQEERELDLCKRSTSRGRGDLSMTRESQQQVSERLFSQNIKNLRKSSQNRQDETSNDKSAGYISQNQLNITNQLNNTKISSKEITQKLYEDAKQRQKSKEKQMRSISGKRLKSYSSNNDQTSCNTSFQIRASVRSNELFASRLLKQIDKAFQDLDCLNMNSINLETFSDLLSYLGFIGEDINNKERLLQDAWKHLGGSEDRNISKRSFIIFIYSLNNLYFPWMSENQSQQTLANQPLTEIQEYSDFYVRNEQEVAQIHYKFFAFWEYRSKIKTSKASTINTSYTQNLNQSHLIIQGETFSSNKNSNPSLSFMINPLSTRFNKINCEEVKLQQNSYKPQINEKSQKLAETHLNQLKQELEELGIPFNHQDYLIKKGILIKEKQKEKEAVQIEKILQPCTFHPQTTEKSNQIKRDKSVFDVLYGDQKIHKDKKAQRKDRDVVDIEFERQKSECSFQPNKLDRRQALQQMENKSQTRVQQNSFTKQQIAKPQIISQFQSTLKNGSSLNTVRNFNTSTPGQSAKKENINSGFGMGVQQKTQYTIRHNKALQEKQLTINQKIQESNPFSKGNQKSMGEKSKSQLTIGNNGVKQNQQTNRKQILDEEQRDGSQIRPYNPYHRSSKGNKFGHLLHHPQTFISHNSVNHQLNPLKLNPSSTTHSSNQTKFQSHRYQDSSQPQSFQQVDQDTLQRSFHDALDSQQQSPTGKLSQSDIYQKVLNSSGKKKKTIMYRKDKYHAEEDINVIDDSDEEIQRNGFGIADSGKKLVDRQLSDDRGLPLLFLDVNLGLGKVSRLTVFDGDVPEVVADKFIISNKLDEGKREKLLAAINYQLDQIRKNNRIK